MFHMLLKQDIYIIIVTKHLNKIVHVLHGASTKKMNFFNRCDINAFRKMKNNIKFDKYERDININHFWWKMPYITN